MNAAPGRSTSDLVDALAAELSPRPRAWAVRRLAWGLGAGVVVSAIVTLVLWGPRPDLVKALATGPLWAKLGFTGLLAAAGLAAAGRLARPGLGARSATGLAFAVVLAMACLAGAQLAGAPTGEARRLVMGSTAASCPWLIMALALPVLAGGLWAVRGMAPTHLPGAGAALGLAAGGAAACVYAVSCDESAMPFVLVWYGLGIAVPIAIGALLGPRLLRW